MKDMYINGFGIDRIDRIEIVSQEDNEELTPLEFTFRQLINPEVNYNEETGRLNISVYMSQCYVKEIDDNTYNSISSHDCLTFSCNNPTDYEVAVTKALKDGYKLESSSCNSKEWKAIMVK